MKSFVSLNKNRDFIRAYHKGRSAVTPCLALYIRPNGKPVNRVGITVSKKIGGAVERNRAKRIIRAAYVQAAPQLRPGFDLVFVARSSTVRKKTQDVYKALIGAARRENLLMDCTLCAEDSE